MLAVVPDEIRQPDTVSSPDFLGLTGKKGLWAQVVGKKAPATDAGRDAVVGVVDSGVRPEAASFQDRGHPAAPADWAGGCETGDEEAFPADSCNDKLIGAKYFVQGFGAGRLVPVETLSPLDAGGHGTHTASTVADAPASVTVDRDADGLELPVLSGVDGTLTTRVNGLTAGTEHIGTTVRRMFFDSTDPALTGHDFAYPRGYPTVRIEAETSAEDVDLDVYVTGSWTSYPVARSVTRGTGMEVFQGPIYSSAPQHRIFVVVKTGADGMEHDEPIDYTLREFFPQAGGGGGGAPSALRRRTPVATATAGAASLGGRPCRRPAPLPWNPCLTRLPAPRRRRPPPAPPRTPRTSASR
ncbi:hypothetical protein [Micrococcus endophyticus]|uniref:hypothetical protein n=1 Tax=Micrococcus endophyticus TaxID=455343 RepID=UPI0034CDE9BA